MIRRRSLLALGVLALSFTPTLAQAQEASAFALNRYNPSERGSDWFANESLDLRGHLRPALGVVGDWSYKPLVLYDADGEEITPIVEHQIYAHVGGGLILWDRVRGAVSIPLLAYNDGERGTTANQTFSSEDATTLGDVRLGLDVRLLGVYRSPFSLAVGTHVHLPTGNQNAYASDGKVRVQPHLLAAGDIGIFAYAAQVGFNYRANHGQLDGAPFGSELTFAAAAGLRLLRKRLLVGPEVYGSTVVSESDAAFDRRTTPVEAILGGKFEAFQGFRVGAGVGPGLTRGFGAPMVRVLAALEWMPAIEEKQPPPPPSDRDGDGIIDKQDACPDEPGVASDDAEKNGCPPPADRDGDGILDDDDACPDEPGVASDDPEKNGCPPPPDRDGDGILDDDDACPDEPGVASDDPQKNGCPPPQDRDGDGIFDDDDACPDQAGKPNEDPKKNGCPIAIKTEEKIEILQRVEFETNKAVLRPESDEVLEAVRKVLEDNPDVTKILVEGHTDDRGADYYNLALSKRRAAAVVKWLTDHGIAAGRLTSQGFGETKPIDSNDTEEGRQNNRRVEFRIIEQSGKAVEPQTEVRKQTSTTEPGDGAEGEE